jgi:hypothetical protein
MDTLFLLNSILVSGKRSTLYYNNSTPLPILYMKYIITL